MDDIITLGGGSYIVKKNPGGGIDFRYGYSEIEIVNGNCIKVRCIDDENVSRIILKFTIINVIPREYKILEKIQIYLKMGFNTIYAYSYSDIDKFKRACEGYFRELDEQLNVKETICNTCHGKGLIKK